MQPVITFDNSNYGPQSFGNVRTYTDDGYVETYYQVRHTDNGVRARVVTDTFRNEHGFTTEIVKSNITVAEAKDFLAS